jgi:hypothetical protein
VVRLSCRRHLSLLGACKSATFDGVVALETWRCVIQ